MRTLRRDIAQYNKEDEEIDETLEETGWKLVHGDIFRPPTKSTILCALVGSGIQIGMMGLITIIVAMFGMLSPSARGSLITGELYFMSHSVDNEFFQPRASCLCLWESFLVTLVVDFTRLSVVKTGRAPPSGQVYSIRALFLERASF